LIVIPGYYVHTYSS